MNKKYTTFKVGKKVVYAVYRCDADEKTVLLNECELFLAESELHNHLIKISK